MNFANITIGLAFLAGLASFLSPCVFALVPAYVGYLSGRSLSLAGKENKKSQQWATFTHGVAFVIGFSFIFILLGVAASVMGGFLWNLRGWLTRIGGILVVVFGLHMTGIIHIPILEYDLRPGTIPDRNRGYLSSAMMGVFFSAGWSPCVGPVLGAILTLAINGGSLTQGAVLLTAYSAGLAIPFLFASLGIEWVTNVLRKYSSVIRYSTIGMGVLLIIVGVLLFTGRFETLAQYGFFVDFGL